jgi:glycosyltransferase involved in cell wall biosynthesis
VKIIYDHKIFYLQKYGGISNYFINLCNKVKLSHDAKIIAPIHVNNYLEKFDNKNKLTFIKLQKQFKYTRKISNKINDYFFYNYCRFKNPDIVHLTYFDKLISFKKKFKVIVTVYDLIHEIYEKKYDFKYPKNFKSTYLNIADEIICISENTKRDLIKYYDIDEKKITVIYLGVNKGTKYKEIKNLNLDKPYLLFVGDRKKYKNFDNFMISFSKSDKLKKDFNIICFGGGSVSIIELKKINDLKIDTNNIKFINGDEFELNYIYKNAKAFICPSLYEGFGLTILEAMNMNCPVITSNTSSLKEVGGDAAVYFNPVNIDDIKYKIESVVYSDNKIFELRDKMTNNNNRFDLNFTAQQTLNVYEK